jgi:hypothetical protein
VSILNAVGMALAVLCPLAVCLFAILVVFALSGRREDLPLFVEDTTPFEDEPVVDPPVVPVHVEPMPGWVMFRDGLVHIACLGPYLRDGTRPCRGCADHFERVLTGAQ